jgi:hypothetical protein
MKKLLTPALALVALAVLTGLSVVQGAPHKALQKGRFASLEIGEPATVLVCKRPAIPDQGLERCHGNWLLGDNTDNWKYQASQGPDHFIRKNGNPGDRSCMKCPNSSTSLRVDFNGLEDWCVKPGQTAATATPSCPSGFTWNGNICTRPATPAQGVERCHGNWLLGDNTDNWKYQASQGPDHFIRKNGNPGDRSCMKCPNSSTSLRVDFSGLEDWCVKPGQTAATVAGICPPGFTLGPQ